MNEKDNLQGIQKVVQGNKINYRSHGSAWNSTDNPDKDYLLRYPKL